MIVTQMPPSLRRPMNTNSTLDDSGVSLDHLINLSIQIFAAQVMCHMSQLGGASTF